MITGHLSLDLETKSPLDLVKVGVYRYAEEAEILMCSYSFDDGPVEIWDIYDGGPPEKLLSGLRDPKIQKHAFNSNFERTLIKACWGIDCPPEEWRCTAVLALTLGIPHHLADCAEFLNVAKKDPRGKKLIKLFTSPQRPTKKQPKVWLTKEDRPKEWEAFKAYCVQDTVVEKEIHKKLIRFDLPPEEWRLWALDQRMNDRGALIDTKLVTQAIAIDDRRTEALLAEAVAITGLQNPNSVAQLKQWLLEEHDQEIKSLNKKVVAELKNVLGGEAGRMLSIRSQLGKTSIDKYRAMARSVCADGRVRGLLQFAGAQRTGRWAGRIIQVQNLPHNKLDDIDLARQIVLTGDEELLEMLFGNVSGVLSELLRTAFIAPSGDLLVPCDESAIEARVLAWTAGEQWRLDVFNGHGRIYEASASAMFKVPLSEFTDYKKKTGKHHPLRAKGKVAELACIAEGQLVLTDVGLVPIQAVTTRMKVWDGDAFVSHKGVIYRGIREVIRYEGLTATEDHIVWTDEGTQEFSRAASRGSHLVKSGEGWNPVRVGGDHQPRRTLYKRMVRPVRTNQMLRVWLGKLAMPIESFKRIIERVPIVLSAGSTEMAIEAGHVNALPMRKQKRSWLQELWSARNKVFLSFRESRSSVDLGDSRGRQNERVGSDRQQRGLCPGKSKVLHQAREYAEFEILQADSQRREVGAYEEPICANDDTTISGVRRYKGRGCAQGQESSYRQAEKLEGNTEKVGTARVYDLLECGPLNRFTVSGCLVHNCGYQGATGALITMGALDMGLVEDELRPIVDAWRAANPTIVKVWEDIEADAITCVRDKIPRGRAGKWEFSMEAGCLFMKLPSGRRLAYPKAKLGTNKWGWTSVIFWGMDQKTKQWGWVETYGGKLCENHTQAVARDVLREALFNCEAAGYERCVFTVHDEGVFEVPSDNDSAVQEIEALFAQPISWAPGLPLKAAGFTTSYYKKGD